jgi:hypothetical protein
MGQAFRRQSAANPPAPAPATPANVAAKTVSPIFYSLLSFSLRLNFCNQTSIIMKRS